MKQSLFTILYIIFFIILAVMLFKFFLGVVLVALVLAWLRTLQMHKEPNQIDFSNGSVPNPLPEGFYHGTAGFNTSWIGKKFDAAKATGINVLRQKNGTEIEKYSFKTHAGNGLFDKTVFVLKIDYNIPENPFWIRWILDEMVQVAPNHYLGKMQLRIIPGLPFSLLYFELKKP